MQKAQINKLIPGLYPSLLNTSKRMCYKYRRNYPPEEVITIAYLYIINISHKVEDADMLRRYLTAKICQEIALSQSETNRKLNSRHHELIEDVTVQYTEYCDPYEDEVKALEQYRTVPDRVKRRVFEVYFDKGENTCRKMAEYFNISIKSAMDLIREMKEDLKQIAED